MKDYSRTRFVTRCILALLVPPLLFAAIAAFTTDSPMSVVSLPDIAERFYIDSGLLQVSVVALLASLSIHGHRALARGFGFAIAGHRSDEPHSQQPGLLAGAEAVALVARLVLWGCLLVEFTKCYADLHMVRSVLDGVPISEAQDRPGAYRGMAGAALPPLAAIVVGRLWLGGWADAVFRQSARPERAAFPPGADFAVLLFLLPLLLHLFLAFYQFPIQ